MTTPHEAENDRITISIALADFDWIADHIAVSEELGAVFDAAVEVEDRVHLSLDDSDLDELLNCLADLGEEADDEGLAGVSARIAQSIESQIPEGFYWPGDFEGGGDYDDEEGEGGLDIENMDPETLMSVLMTANLPEAVQRRMAELNDDAGEEGITEEAMMARMAPLMEEFRDKPLPEYNGLTLAQFMMLMQAEWSTEESPLQTSSDIPAADLADLDAVFNARLLLDTAAAGGMALDEDYLDTASVRAIAPRMRLGDPDLLAEMLNDDDFDGSDLMELEQLRTVCEAAGLLEATEEGDRLRPTELGDALRAPEAAGGLLEALFLGHLQYCALDWNDPEDAWPSLQLGVAFSLYAISQIGPDGESVANLADRAMLPSAEIDEPRPILVEDIPINLRAVLFHCRVLDPLVQYGIVEVDGEEDEEACADHCMVRKTPLFDALIRFDFSTLAAG